MPRSTHPRPRHRHDRAHVRYHRDRLVKKRARAYIAARPAWIEAYERGLTDGPWGRNANEAWWRGCHRAPCGVCHPVDLRRARGLREWRAILDAAY